MKTNIILLSLVLGSTTLSAQTLADYANAGDAAMKAGKMQEAIDNYIKAQELDKDNTDYLTAFQLGTAYEAVGELQKAGDAYKASIIKGNYDGGVITNMKNAYEGAGCNDCVKSAYIEIKTTNPAQTIPMDRKLYFIYVKEKNYEEALKCEISELNDVSLDEQGKIKIYKRVAQLFINVDQPDSAEVYYDKVLAITPDDADVHKALGYGLYNAIQKATKNAQAAYKAKAKPTQHDFSVMQTAQKRATLAYGPKAIRHLETANKTLNDKQIADIITKLRQNVAAYSK